MFYEGLTTARAKCYVYMTRTKKGSEFEYACTLAKEQACVGTRVCVNGIVHVCVDAFVCIDVNVRV